MEEITIIAKSKFTGNILFFKEVGYDKYYKTRYHRYMCFNVICRDVFYNLSEIFEVSDVIKICKNER